MEMPSHSEERQLRIARDQQGGFFVLNLGRFMKIRVFFQSLFPSLRASELAEFRQWIYVRNINRARLVGYLLLPFAIVGLIPETGISTFIPELPLVELITITIALLLLEWGRHRMRRWMLALGQIVLFLSASGWMVVSILSRLEIAFALPEFIIGVLALALMRILSPLRGVFAFSGMAATYVIILVHYDHYDGDVISNVVLVSALALFWSWGMYRGRIMEFRNKQLVEQLQQRNHELNLLAEHDSLTSLPNRRSFDQLMERWWSDPAMQNTDVSLMLIDADFFKQYNDAYGHPAGDLCLQKIAHSLQHNLRDEGTVMRLGGEEFVVALEGLSLETSLSIARRLVKRVADETETTVSAGVASVRPSQADSRQLYHLADAALYRAKSAGRNRAAT